ARGQDDRRRASRGDQRGVRLGRVQLDEDARRRRGDRERQRRRGRARASHRRERGPHPRDAGARAAAQPRRPRPRGHPRRRRLGLVGNWGLPYTPAGAEGLSLDGKTLVLAGTSSGQTSPSLFMVVNPRTMRIVRPITLNGYFSFDAMSPDASRLYFIQYTK